MLFLGELLVHVRICLEEVEEGGEVSLSSESTKSGP